ncbi:MAG: hypothetical protein GY822_11430 [Deltaproteobacteria bacterium]|nr:hypothetical protein [Deltaproteobacteria bacterium]
MNPLARVLEQLELLPASHIQYYERIADQNEIPFVQLLAREKAFVPGLLAKSLAGHFNLPARAVEVSHLDVPAALRIIPADGIRLRVLPLGVVGDNFDSLALGMSNPMDHDAAREVEAATGLSVVRVVVDDGALGFAWDALEQHLRNNPEIVVPTPSARSPVLATVEHEDSPTSARSIFDQMQEEDDSQLDGILGVSQEEAPFDSGPVTGEEMDLDGLLSAVLLDDDDDDGFGEMLQLDDKVAAEGDEWLIDPKTGVVDDDDEIRLDPDADEGIEEEFVPDGDGGEEIDFVLEEGEVEAAADNGEGEKIDFAFEESEVEAAQGIDEIDFSNDDDEIDFADFLGSDDVQKEDNDGDEIDFADFVRGEEAEDPLQDPSISELLDDDDEVEVDHIRPSERVGEERKSATSFDDYEKMNKDLTDFAEELEDDEDDFDAIHFSDEGDAIHQELADLALQLNEPSPEAKHFKDELEEVEREFSDEPAQFQDLTLSGLDSEKRSDAPGDVVKRNPSGFGEIPSTIVEPDEHSFLGEERSSEKSIATFNDDAAGVLPSNGPPPADENRADLFQGGATRHQDEAGANASLFTEVATRQVSLSDLSQAQAAAQSSESVDVRSDKDAKDDPWILPRSNIEAGFDDVMEDTSSVDAFSSDDESTRLVDVNSLPLGVPVADSTSSFDKVGSVPVGPPVANDSSGFDDVATRMVDVNSLDLGVVAPNTPPGFNGVAAQIVAPEADVLAPVANDSSAFDDVAARMVDVNSLDIGAIGMGGPSGFEDVATQMVEPTPMAPVPVGPPTASDSSGFDDVATRRVDVSSLDLGGVVPGSPSGFNDVATQMVDPKPTAPVPVGPQAAKPPPGFNDVATQMVEPAPMVKAPLGPSIANDSFGFDDAATRMVDVNSLSLDSPAEMDSSGAEDAATRMVNVSEISIDEVVTPHKATDVPQEEPSGFQNFPTTPVSKEQLSRLRSLALAAEEPPFIDDIEDDSNGFSDVPTQPVSLKELSMLLGNSPKKNK